MLGVTAVLTLVIVHLMRMCALKHIVKLDNVGVSRVSLKRIASAIETEDEPVGSPFGGIHVVSVFMLIVYMSGYVDLRAAIGVIGLRSRLGHRGGCASGVRICEEDERIRSM